MTKKNQRESEREARVKLVKQKRLEQAMAARAMKKQRGRGAIRNDGEIVDRKPLTVWEQYAQALLFTNEMAYVN